MALLIYDNGNLVKNPSEIRIPERSVMPIENPAHSAGAGLNTGVNSEDTPIPTRRTVLAANRRMPLGSSRLYEETGKKSDSLQDRRRLSAIHVMSSPVVTANQYDTIADSWLKMQQEEIDHLIVINSQGHPLGAVTGGELLKYGQDSNSFIENLLDRALIAVSTDTLVREIALIFMEQKVSCVPVVNQDHQVIGIVCRSDLLSLLVSGPNLEQKA